MVHLATRTTSTKIARPLINLGYTHFDGSDVARTFDRSNRDLALFQLTPYLLGR